MPISNALDSFCILENSSKLFLNIFVDIVLLFFLFELLRTVGEHFSQKTLKKAIKFLAVISPPFEFHFMKIHDFYPLNFLGLLSCTK